MEQTFEEQCKEDSRLAKKLVFICENLHLIEEGITRNDNIKLNIVKKAAPNVIDCTCFGCGTAFKRLSYKIKSAGKSYCSPQCRSSQKNDALYIKARCKYCHVESSRLKSAVESGRFVFCSRDCRTAHRRLFAKSSFKAASGTLAALHPEDQPRCMPAQTAQP